jgi:hypothetical protein
MSQVTGIVKVLLNGTTQRSEIGAELDFGGKERTAAVGHKLYGFSEKLVPSHLKFTMFHMSDTDLLTLKDITNGTAAFVCDTGPVFPVTNATVVKTVKLKGGDGKVEVEMEGDPIDTQQ